ncbi:uncharacterized protein EV154DRAFT_477394 [Mucor mucedo]|uniref:uncharacterized protein n=1 Tax=Mucor mucedo TaxID=29922 RepID=UPI00221E560C|nr:uncharacterized protein EV154DRAFT_477394 [Mucor mucedo]KAI7895600.1 hypothetical protein EV154DRAFT_477394 [Mucor mucedo]
MLCEYLNLENCLSYCQESQILAVDDIQSVIDDLTGLQAHFSPSLASDCKIPDPQSHDEDGWDVYQAIEYAKSLNMIGVDVIDVSSGGSRSDVNYVVYKLYQVPFSKAVKHKAGISTGRGRDFAKGKKPTTSGWVMNRCAVELGICMEYNPVKHCHIAFLAKISNIDRQSPDYQSTKMSNWHRSISSFVV